MLNKSFVQGRLTRDPDLRYTQSGTPVASFTLAVERDFKDKATGEKVTDFLDIVAWRSTAEFVSKYFVKGRMAIVEGRIQVRPWTDKEGNKRKSTEIIAGNVYFGDSKKDNDSNGYHQGYTGNSDNDTTSSSFPPPGSEFTEINDDDGELPF